MEIKDIYT